VKNEVAKIESDEIDLLDLFKILYKNRVLIVVVTVVVTLASLGGALYVRSNTNNLSAVDFRLKNGLDNFYLGKAKLDIEEFDEREMLKNKEIVDELVEVPSLKESFGATGKAENFANKKKFLEDKIGLERVEEEVDKKMVVRYYQLSMENTGDIEEEEVMNRYLEILNRERYMGYEETIDEKYSEVKGKVEFYGEKLSKIDEEIRSLLDKESETILRNEGVVGILSVKYPKTMNEQNTVKELYIKYNNELTGLEGLKNDSGMKKQVEVLSSYYEVKQESKAKLILALGIVMGMIMGVMAAFIKEFVRYFKENL